MSDKPLQRLTRRVQLTHEADVARMRRVLNERGYDADPLDIEAAYAAWSRSLPKQPMWHPPSYLNDLVLWEHLSQQFDFPPPSEEPAVEPPSREPASSPGDASSPALVPASPVMEPSHADPQSEQDGGRTADEAPAPARAPSDLPRVPDRGAPDRGGRRNGR